MGHDRCSRWVTLSAVCLLALIAAVVSYSHMFELALRHGEPAWRAALFPLSVDGMMVAASMALLSDARQGRRGGLLPWTLLIIGSGASLAANVAVADPTVWSRIIHAWPSFALMGAYELLMRQFRADAAGVLPAYSGSTPEPATVTTAAEMPSVDLLDPPQDGKDNLERRPLRGVTPDPPASVAESGGSVVVDRRPPAIQCAAWAWAFQRRGEDGTLPGGREIAQAFGRSARWGRMVKQRGEAGVLAGEHLAGEPRENAGPVGATEAHVAARAAA